MKRSEASRDLGIAQAARQAGEALGGPATSGAAAAGRQGLNVGDDDGRC
jgi:hypothetical protein